MLNDFIFDIWLWHGDLYRVSPFHSIINNKNMSKSNMSHKLRLGATTRIAIANQ
jgi:hypothetical protein